MDWQTVFLWVLGAQVVIGCFMTARMNTVWKNMLKTYADISAMQQDSFENFERARRGQVPVPEELKAQLQKKLTEVKPGEELDLCAEEKLAILIFGIASFFPEHIVKMKMSMGLEWMNEEEIQRMGKLLRE